MATEKHKLIVKAGHSLVVVQKNNESCDMVAMIEMKEGYLDVAVWGKNGYKKKFVINNVEMEQFIFEETRYAFKYLPVGTDPIIKKVEAIREVVSVSFITVERWP